MHINRNHLHNITKPHAYRHMEFDVYVTMHHVKFLIIKPTRCTNFSNCFLEWNSTCFRQLLCPSSGVFHCTYSNGMCYTGLLTACEQNQDGTCWSCLQLSATVQWKTPDDGQRSCLKHVEFHSKNKFEKLVHLIDFIIRNLSRCTVTWTSNQTWCIFRQHANICLTAHMCALWKLESADLE